MPSWRATAATTGSGTAAGSGWNVPIARTVTNWVAYPSWVTRSVRRRITARSAPLRWHTRPSQSRSSSAGNCAYEATLARSAVTGMLASGRWLLQAPHLSPGGPGSADGNAATVA